MISIIKAIILSIVQGITEWLPISSSGHLALFGHFFSFQDLPFDIFLHFASVLAVIVIFWKDIIKICDIRQKGNVRFILLMLLALIPAVVVGIFFSEVISGFFSNLFYLGLFFILSGVIVYSTKFVKPSKKRISWLDSLFIGIFQALAILPGISRSGSTISAGLFRGIKKDDVIRFSFLMSIPLILGASIMEAKSIVFGNIDYLILAVSFIVTFFISLFAIRILLKIIRGGRFYLFGLYNLLLGIFILVWKLLVSFV
ncbi:undecaprenyl-diphosphate phosphatase [Candidatus Pacearchaeota archaeon]|nr:undecaprenyl-diphosphate phosphatase [Candidatus Pacearchaeota archaeon]